MASIARRATEGRPPTGGAGEGADSAHVLRSVTLAGLHTTRKNAKLRARLLSPSGRTVAERLADRLGIDVIVADLSSESPGG